MNSNGPSKAGRAKTILVTGAGMGIGAEAAKELAGGNRLILHYHSSEEDVKRLQGDLAGRCTEALAFKADLSTEAGCRSLYKEVNSRYEALDVLINNAGGMVERRTVDALDWGHLSDSFTLNTFSTMYLTGLSADLLRKGTDPCVINVTSIAQRHGAPTATAYGAAKAAIDSFTRGAAKELAPHIRVNAVAPGIIDTRFHDRVTPPEKMKEFIVSTPLRRAGNVSDVAQTIKFLVESDFITGETIDCNGGLSMR
jgi:3-oxoacyl-[acyl-carrier protein] reductase